MPIIVELVVRTVRTVCARHQFNAVGLGVIAPMLLVIIQASEQGITRLAGVYAGGRRLTARHSAASVGLSVRLLAVRTQNAHKVEKSWSRKSNYLL